MSSPTPGAKTPGKRHRPPKLRGDGREPRQLVRWDNDLDIQLLLTVQQSCNATGVKIPWSLCAETMGTKFTEGAIIQHLSKLRTRREAENKPVPPPLRRSIPAAANATGKTSRKKSTSKRDNEQAPSSDGDLTDDEPIDWTSEEENQNPKRRRKSKKNSDPAWKRSHLPRKESHRLKGRDRRVSATSQKRKDHDVSDAHDEGSDEDALMCVGAPFLNFGNNSDEDPDYDSGDESISVSNFNGESENYEGSKIVCLPIDANALYNLSVSGHVGGAPMEMTPDQSTPGTGSQQIHSSPSNLGGHGSQLMSPVSYRSHAVYLGNGPNPFNIYSNPTLSQVAYPTEQQSPVVTGGFGHGNPNGPPFQAIARGSRPMSPYEESVAPQFMGAPTGFVQQPSYLHPAGMHANVNPPVLGGNTGNGAENWNQYLNWDESADSSSYAPASMFAEYNEGTAAEDDMMGSIEKTDAIDPTLRDDDDFNFYESKNIY
ncbi:uncharacterized protein N7483_001102 [Penicillium malachiteum]|uniref:uncharacterized protein n=1 Tax=Penicillium malachiteum TaxID=1324776 RepID=UPI0025473DC3|nr:uncharacterized protein N7483_001102 [Penicillium malachiteum]KAJ5735977.1 hypothetical protein N7483_001102 [Penicillium malachiteum]